MARPALSLIASRATTPLIYLVLLILWEFCTRFFKVPGWILPAPSAILAAAADWAPDLFYNSYVTLRETVLGLCWRLSYRCRSRSSSPSLSP